MTRCSICHTLVQPTETPTKCAACGQEYHASCWSELGGCATYGCAQAVAAEKPPPPARLGMGWGDEKECPDCQRKIGASLLVCRCGAHFPYAEPMTADEYRAWSDEQHELRTARRTLVWLFILSLFGLPAPILGPIAGVYAHTKRAKLMGADGTYLAMGYGTAAIGFTYAGVVLLLLAGK